MPGFIKIATIHDIPDNEVRAFAYDGGQIAVYNVGGQFYATDNICSHAYSELHEGYVDTDDCTIECPLHGSRFDIRTGAVLSLPAYEPIDVYPVRVEGEDIFVEIGD